MFIKNTFDLLKITLLLRISSILYVFIKNTSDNQTLTYLKSQCLLRIIIINQKYDVYQEYIVFIKNNMYLLRITVFIKNNSVY